MSLPYVERSAKIVDALDPDQIAGMYIGDVIYENDYFVRHAIGHVLLGGESVYLGIELPKRRCNSQMLFVDDLRQISYMIKENEPGLLPYAPSFVGAVSGKDEKAYQARAVLTEDLTQGGHYKLEPKPASDEFQKKGVHLGIEPSGPHALMTAMPASQEKIVSFFPTPFGMAYDIRDLLGDQILEAQEALTVVLDDESALAADLTRHGK